MVQECAQDRSFRHKYQHVTSTHIHTYIHYVFHVLGVYPENIRTLTFGVRQRLSMTMTTYCNRHIHCYTFRLKLVKFLEDAAVHCEKQTESLSSSFTLSFHHLTSSQVRSQLFLPNSNLLCGLSCVS